MHGAVITPSAVESEMSGNTMDAQFQPSAGNVSVDAVITIVHGTIFRVRLVEFVRSVVWPRTRRRWLHPTRSAWELRERSSWLGPRSQLRRTLAQLGDTGNVRVFPFFWSGRNGVLARTAAATRLKKKVEMRLQEYPGARHFIIAHSHGGNVALYAIRESPLMRSQLDGLVFLSTPFLHVERREQRVHLSAWIVLGVLLSMFLTLLVKRQLFPASWETQPLAGDTLSAWATIFTFLCILVTSAAVYVLCERDAMNLVDTHLAFPQGKLPPILTIRARADEALMALGVADFLLWASNQLWLRTWVLRWRAKEFLYVAFDRLTEASFLVHLLFLIGYFTLFFVCLILFAKGPLELPFLLGLYGITLLIVAGEIVWGPLLLLVWLTATVCILPFGGRLAIASAFFEINVSGSPPGMCDQEILPAVAMRFGLAHSASYQDQHALDALVDWIRAQMKRHTPSPL